MADEAGEIRTGQDLDAEALARRRLALAQIRQYPDPVLRMKARDVDAFDDALAQLAERMKVLMREAQGVGLAATQVGVLQRLFVFQPGDEEEEPRAIVNPTLAERSGEVNIDDEGCLSLQRVLVPVERHTRVRLEGNDVDGSDVSIDLDEMAARVVQHELDHLDGVLILDRTNNEARREALATLREQFTIA
jgi:peptide deformylase